MLNGVLSLVKLWNCPCFFPDLFIYVFIYTLFNVDNSPMLFFEKTKIAIHNETLKHPVC